MEGFYGNKRMSGMQHSDGSLAKISIEECKINMCSLRLLKRRYMSLLRWIPD